MNTFEYTDYAYPNSSLVKVVVYNENTRKLLISLDGQGYLYTDVPKDDYKALVDADSVGRHYSNSFKKAHGPATHTGHDGGFWDIQFIEVKVATPQQTVGTPKGLTYADNAKIDEKIEDNLFDLSGKRTDDGQVIVPLFDLASEVLNLEATTRHKVTFDVVGSAKKRKYNVNAASVDEAVAQVQDIADMLGLEFVVRKVTTYFE